MNLIVDIGNTLIKVGVVAHGAVQESFSMEVWSEVVIKNIVSKYDIARSIVCSTRGEQNKIVESLRRVVGHALVFDSSVEVPIDVQYSTPATLGRDRVAAAVGAREIYGAEDVLIVDFGSAITIDLVSKDGGFEGGVISAGVGMRLRALHEYTASLPLCEPTHEVKEIARSTQEALEQGVMQGVQFEIEGHISRFLAKYSKLLVIFLGGDAIFFEKRIKSAIFANRDLLFVGLSRILDYNAE